MKKTDDPSVLRDHFITGIDRLLKQPMSVMWGTGDARTVGAARRYGAHRYPRGVGQRSVRYVPRDPWGDD